MTAVAVSMERPKFRPRGLFTKPWELLSAGFNDLHHPPAGNRPCLDVLRSLAVCLVVIYHIRGYTPNALLTLKMPFVRFGWTGVDLFFVLSGLLIGGQLWKELKASGTVNVKRFILRRGFRIWPFYYSVVFLLLGEQIFLGRERPGLWLDATFLSNYYSYFQVGKHQIAGGWSLSLEEQFYLLIPILLMVCAKFVSPKSLFGLMMVWLAALPVVRHFALLGLHDPTERWASVYYTFHTHSDGLAMGLLISWIMTWKPELLGIGRWLDVLLGVVFLVGCYLWYSVQLTFLYSLVAVCFGALTFLSLRVRLPFFLRSNVFYIISRLSFGVYLLHPGVFAHVMSFHTHLFGEGFRSFFFAFLIWGTVSLALAFATFSFIELPFLKMRDRLLAKNRVIDAAHGEASSVTSNSAS
jgi:peptidoglycan/LPS O-acetylase OafA/YrhL